ncbi:MAG: hypothetical protein ACR2NM_01185 [Bythopirellula sp.]
MPNRLDLPADLEALIEKREQEERRDEDQGVEAREAEPEATEDERKSSADRRANES